MKLVDEFREPEVVTKAAEEKRRRANLSRHGHTHAICSFGLKDVLPARWLLPRTEKSAWRLPWQYRGFNTMER